MLRGPIAFSASAVTGENCPAIMRRIDQLIARGATEVELELPHSAGDAVAWLYRHADIRARSDEEMGVTLRLRAAPPVIARFTSKYPAFTPKQPQKQPQKLPAGGESQRTAAI